MKPIYVRQHSLQHGYRFMRLVQSLPKMPLALSYPDAEKLILVDYTLPRSLLFRQRLGTFVWRDLKERIRE